MMTNYRLEEFKAWLEEDERRKKGLTDWEDYFASPCFNLIVENPPLSEEKYSDLHAVTIRQWMFEVNHSQIQELKLANDVHQQALQTSQEWHERQKAEIITQWKTKLQTFINQRKTQLQQEIQLIKEVLNE